MTVAPRTWILLLHLCTPHLTAAAPSDLRVLAKRSSASRDGLIAGAVSIVLVICLLCWCMAACDAMCCCCGGCGDSLRDDSDDRPSCLSGGPSYWLFLASRGRYGAPPAPRDPPPPEFELKHVETDDSRDWNGGALPQAHSPRWQPQADHEERRHRRLRSDSQIFREALDAERRPPVPESSRADGPNTRRDQDEVARDAVDGWRKGVPGPGIVDHD